MKKYQPVLLLNIDSKAFEKCILRVFFDHFLKFLNKHQKGAVLPPDHCCPSSKKSKRHYRRNLRDDDITIFVSDFSKAFDEVPHRKFLQKLSQMGVGG